MLKKNVDEDYEFGNDYEQEKRRRRLTDNDIQFDSIFSHRPKSYEPCYYQQQEKQQQQTPIGRLVFQDEIGPGIFTISSTSSPVVFTHNESLVKSTDFLDSIEMPSVKRHQQQSRKPKKLSSLLRPSNYFDSSSPSLSTSVFTSIKLDESGEESDTCSLLLSGRKESDDSGYHGFTSIDLVSLPQSSSITSNQQVVATTTTSYLVMIQPNKQNGQSIFRYLFDLSHLVKDTFFKLSASYLTRIKQKLVSYVVETTAAFSNRRHENMLSFKSATKTTPSNSMDMPFSIMSLLSKLNIFNLFRTTRINNKTDMSSTAPHLVKFSPLRQFFLRLFDINFF